MNQPYTKLQIVIICAVLAFLILIALWLSGCAQMSRTQHSKLIYSDGCLMIIEGASQTTADTTEKDFSFDKCKIETTVDRD